MTTTADACWAGPLSSEERAELAAMLDRWCWKFDAAAAGCNLPQIGIALRCSHAATEMAMLYRDAMLAAGDSATSPDDPGPDAGRMARAERADYPRTTAAMAAREKES